MCASERCSKMHGRRNNKRMSKGWMRTTMVVVSAFMMEGSTVCAFTPVTEGRDGATLSGRYWQGRSKVSSSSDGLYYAPRNTDLGVTLSSLNADIESSRASGSHEVEEARKRLERQQQLENEARFRDEIMNLPCRSRVVSTGKRNRNSRMFRPKSLHSSAKVVEGGKNSISTNSDRIQVRLLTGDEERILTHNLRSFRKAAIIRDELFEPSEQEWADACGLTITQLRRVMHDGREARAVLVAANEGLVASIAKRHYYALKNAMEAGNGVGTILSMQDLIQEGNLGLIEAAQRFEPERGLRFCTYATYWVRQRIFRSITDSSRVIRLPAHVHATLKKINDAKKDFKSEIGREPSTPELAHYVEMSVDKLRKYTTSSRNVISLESPLRNGGSLKEDRRTIGDCIVSDAPTPEEDALSKYLKQDIRAVVDGLAATERDVLVLRFGLDSGKSMTVAETAQCLAISRDRVRLVEERALNKLRNPQRSYRLKEYVVGDSLLSIPSQNKAERTKKQEQTASPEKLWFF